MGNAAARKDCGTDTTLKTSGSDQGSEQNSDIPRAAYSGIDLDDCLVRG